MTDLLEIL